MDCRDPCRNSFTDCCDFCRFWGAYGWKPLFAVNIGMALLYLICEFGFGVVYNIKSIIENVDTFGVFPDC